MAGPQHWTLTRDGREHQLTATPAAFSRTLVWRVDDDVVAERKSSEDRLQLVHDGMAVDVRFSALGAARRATLHTAEDDAEARARAMAGIGGVDLVPEPGSAAAEREEWVRAHPRLHTARATVTGVAKVVVPLLLVYLLARFTFSLDLPDIPWPDIPWPDLPDIPWPDIPLPRIPWPDWSLPGWVEQVLDALKLVLPVVLAFVLARAEIRRRRKQDELRGSEDARRGDEEPRQD